MQGEKLFGDEAAFRQVVYNYRYYSAKKRNLEFTLTNEQLRNLFQGNCHYCGISPNTVQLPQGKIGEPFIYNGIDRIDSSKGYTADNCVSSCKSCNSIKYNKKLDEIIQPNSWYGNYFTLQQTTKRKNGSVIWQCHHYIRNEKIVSKEVTSKVLYTAKKYKEIELLKKKGQTVLTLSINQK